MNAQAIQRVATEVARTIRHPKVPIEYNEAVQALKQCISIDEAKYWDDKSEALAAWAKICHDKDALLQARRLKLHAYRRMGELAGELHPVTHTNKPGAVRALRRLGLSQGAATAARRIAQLPERQFDKMLADPIAPSSVAHALWSAS